MFLTPLPEHIDINGTPAEYVVRGHGRKLLFLHGAHGVEPADPFIEALGSDFEVTAASHPGFGASGLPAGSTTVDDLSYFYLDFIERLTLRDVVLVGVSLGGWLAAELATKGTGRFSSLVLIDTVGAKFADRKTREIEDLTSAMASELPELLFSDAEFGRAALHNLDFPNLPEDAARRFARNRETLGLIGWAPTLYNPKLVGRLHRIDIPTLVLWGADDRVVPPDYGRAFAGRIPQAEFVVVERAGHYGCHERPGEFAAKIKNFVGLAAR
jgi:pimeloyl-ACP methyl ester carboxylesterase